MNSGIQCLSNLKPLRDEMIKKLNENTTKSELEKQFASLLNKIWNSNLSIFEPINFKNESTY